MAASVELGLSSNMPRTLGGKLCSRMPTEALRGGRLASNQCPFLLCKYSHYRSAWGPCSVVANAIWQVPGHPELRVCERKHTPNTDVCGRTRASGKRASANLAEKCCSQPFWSGAVACNRIGESLPRGGARTVKLIPEGWMEADLCKFGSKTEVATRGSSKARRQEL